MSKTFPNKRQCIVVAYDTCQVLDVAGPAEALAKANEYAGGEAYDVHIAAARCGKISTNGAVTLHVERDFASFSSTELQTLDTLIVAGGYDINDVVRDATLLKFVGRAALHARRVVSICTGAFVLAELGLLKNCRATTHWESAAQLQGFYPSIAVEPDSIYVRDGRYWTSAGVTAGIDLTLALIEADLGPDVALQTARQLVVYMMRPGGQAQFSTQLQHPRSGQSRLTKLSSWIVENPTADLSVASLASRCAMSERNFNRRFQRELGVTPARFVEQSRLEHARRLLEAPDGSIEKISYASGFGSVDVMRRLFYRRLQLSPSEYRQRFCTSLRPQKEEISYE
ncbi:MAG: GlxA family transcriptional regulator [Pseudomonadota bacterium]